MNIRKTSPALFLACICAIGCISWSNADTEKNDAPVINREEWNRVNKTQAEAQEAKALAEKTDAEAKIQNIQRSQKMQDQLTKSQLDSELAKEAAHKAESEAKSVAANADLNEALCRVMKAKNEMLFLQQHPTVFWETKIAEAKASQAECELRIAKMQADKEKLSKSHAE